MGDGETQEGQIWEAAMSAGHYHLDNLCGIIDYNKLQIDGRVQDVMNIAPVVDKWRAFGWNAVEIDGHDFRQILAAFDQAEKHPGQPTVIVANTVKGKGVSFMEDKEEWHGKSLNKELAAQALKELA
jgi:transketolase